MEVFMSWPMSALRTVDPLHAMCTFTLMCPFFDCPRHLQVKTNRPGLTEGWFFDINSYNEHMMEHKCIVRVENGGTQLVVLRPVQQYPPLPSPPPVAPREWVLPRPQ